MSSCREIICYIVALFIYVRCENGSFLVSSYSKVSRSGSLSENEGRSNSAGQLLWTKRYALNMSAVMVLLCSFD